MSTTVDSHSYRSFQTNSKRKYTLLCKRGIDPFFKKILSLFPTFIRYPHVSLWPDENIGFGQRGADVQCYGVGQNMLLEATGWLWVRVRMPRFDNSWEARGSMFSFQDAGIPTFQRPTDSAAHDRSESPGASLGSLVLLSKVVGSVVLYRPPDNFVKFSTARKKIRAFVEFLE